MTRHAADIANQITADDRQQIEAAVAKKVSPPTPAEYKAEARRKAQKVGWKYLRERQRATLQDEADQWQGKEGELFADIQSLLEGAPAAPRCSFCGKTVEQVDVLVAGGGANICNECVEQAVIAVGNAKRGPR